MRSPSAILLILAVGAATAEEAGAPAAPAAPSGPPIVADEIPTADAGFLAAARAANQVYQHHLFQLRQQLAAPEEAARVEAMLMLSRLSDPTLVEDLTPFLQQDTHSETEVATAIVALANLGATGVAEELRRLARAKSAVIRDAAVYGLARLQLMGLPDYQRELENPAPTTKAMAIVGVGEAQDPESAGKLIAALHGDSNAFIRQRAAIALGQLGQAAHGPQLATALADSNPKVRRYAAEALVALNYKPAIPKLIMGMEANVSGIDIYRCFLRLSGADHQVIDFNPWGGAIERREAIERAFAWWEENSATIVP